MLLILVSMNLLTFAPGWTGDALEESETKPGNLHKQDKMLAHFYYANRENTHLTAEERLVVRAEDPVEFGRNIVNGLIRGPKGDLINPIPNGTTLRTFFISSDRIAYVDLSEAIADHHSGGIESEIMTIFSIVNTLILNISEINAVKIVVNGRETETLAGHIDIRYPFTANMILIR